MKLKIKPNKYTNFIKNNSGTLLTIAGSIGMIATTFFSVKKGMEIKEKELDIKEGIKTCIPVIAGCAGSIACVVAGDALNRKQKSELLAMCATAGASYSAYRKEVIQRYGEEVDKEILDTVANCCDYHYMAPEIPDNVCHWVLNLYQDGIPTYEFDARERDVIHAEYHFNRNYILAGAQSVNDLLRMMCILGPDEEGDEINDAYGWMIDDSEIYFVDFAHRKISEDTIEIYPIFAPWFDYQDLNMWGESIYMDELIAPFGDEVKV